MAKPIQYCKVKKKFFFNLKKRVEEGFPGGSVVKNPPANAGDVVQSLIGKNPHAKEQLSPCTTTVQPVLQSPGAATTEPCAATPEAHVTRTCALQQEKPPQ